MKSASRQSIVSRASTNGTPLAVPNLVQLPWHAAARILLKLDKPPLLLLVGEPGVGKTSFARVAALEATGKEPLILSGSPEIEQSHLWGRWTLVEGETRFVDGPLPLALKDTAGRYLVVEEFSQIPLECRAACMPLRDQTEISNPLTSEVLPIPRGFRLLATSNTEALTCRKNSGIGRVLYDGFQILECGELSDQQVLAFLQHNFPNTSTERRERVLAIWQEYREFTSKGSSGKPHLSYRAAEHLLRLMEAGMTEHQAVQIALVNKFLPNDDDLFSAAKLKNSLGE